MNLSKTAKRFLSSTMAIALAGGSVLAFRSSALAGSAQTDTVSFTGTVDKECAVIAAPTLATYTPSDNSANNSDTANENRTISLEATTTVAYDCNSDAVSVSVASLLATPPTISNATDLSASHEWSWSGTTNAGPTVFAADGSLSASEATDTKGDVSIDIKSAWSANDEELFEGDYTASLSLTVTAQ